MFITFLAVYNLYVFTLAFVYLPSGFSGSSDDFAQRVDMARLEDDDDDNNQLLGVKKGDHVALDTDSTESYRDKDSPSESSEEVSGL